jgi:hypothetical protein
MARISNANSRFPRQILGILATLFAPACKSLEIRRLQIGAMWPDTCSSRKLITLAL